MSCRNVQLGAVIMKKVMRTALKPLLFLWILGILMCLIFVKNPFFLHTIDAAQEQAADMENIFSEKNPYIRIKHMNLTYTGYYNQSGDRIISYCFVGDIGKSSCFVEISAEDVEKTGNNVAEGLKDFSFTGKMVKDDWLLQMAADEEGLSLSDYKEAYNICSVSIYQHSNDLKQVMLYYMLAVLIGCVLFTSIIISKKTKESKVGI